MKIAFVGKGGSGKTTLSALLCRHLVSLGHPVLAIDADINQHLGAALGGEHAESAGDAGDAGDIVVPPMGEHLDEIKDYLRGTNPLVPSAAVMVKTTPPGPGSRLLTVTDSNLLWERFGVEVGGVRLLATGAFTEADLGVACFHSKLGAVELLLNHLVDGAGEYVVVDMTAGADAFASGLFTRFDHTFLVCEPTRKAVAVHRQYREYAAEFDITVSAIGNKITDAADAAFLRAQIGDDLRVCFRQSAPVRALEQGRAFHLDDLEPTNRSALADLHRAIDDTVREPERFRAQMHEIHRRNALAWANDAVGVDLTAQIDPDFRPPYPPVPTPRAAPVAYAGRAGDSPT